jgi:hypothetical protein
MKTVSDLEVQEVRLDEGDAALADNYTSLYANGTDDNRLGTGLYVHTETISAVKRGINMIKQKAVFMGN